MSALNEFLNIFEDENLVKGGDFKITPMEGGGFSEVFMLELLDGRKYIVKKRKEGGRRKIKSLTFAQEADLIELLSTKIDKTKLVIVPPLVFSDKIAIYDYVEGKTPSLRDIDGFLTQLEALIIAYKSLKKENSLQWDHVHLDIFSYLGQKFQFDNFILSKDGTLYFIDPFAYVN